VAEEAAEAAVVGVVEATVEEVEVDSHRHRER
jgi:hypothetical protein